MKNLILIILFFPFIAIGQHTLMINHNNEWITEHFFFTPPIVYTKHTFSHELTVFDGHEFKELLYVDMITGSTSKSGIFYRETGKRIYWYTEQTGEALVYDFNLNVGDTFAQLYSGFSTNPLYVLDVETVFLNDNLPRKKITLLCHPYEEYSRRMIWIEGIGVNSSIGSETGYCNHDIGTYLNCFFQNGQHVYTGEYQNSCFQTVNNIENKSNHLSIFPNPVHDYLNIEQIFSDFRYEIKSMGGKSVQRGRGEQRIDVQQLPTGMYVLEILTGNKVGVMKFVKQ